MKLQRDAVTGHGSIRQPLTRGIAIKWLKGILYAAASSFAVSSIGRAAITSIGWLGAAYIVSPLRFKITTTPADYGAAYEDVTVTTTDGLKLVGWYLPGDNGATIIAQHGYCGNRESLLCEAVSLNQHGYSVLVTTSRGHDESDRRKITFGAHEMKDLEAWYQHLLSREDVDPGAIGILGESMGGGMAILYAARNKNIRTVVTSSAFSLTDETIQDFIFQYFVRPGPIAPAIAQSIVNWVEKKADFRAADIDTVGAIGEISPRPILIIQGGNDKLITPRNGYELFNAAKEPKEMYFIPNGNHCDQQEVEPTKYMGRIVEFFDKSFDWSDEGQGERPQ